MGTLPVSWFELQVLFSWIIVFIQPFAFCGLTLILLAFSQPQGFFTQSLSLAKFLIRWWIFCVSKVSPTWAVGRSVICWVSVVRLMQVWPVLGRARIGHPSANEGGHKSHLQLTATWPSIPHGGQTYGASPSKSRRCRKSLSYSWIFAVRPLHFNCVPF